MAFDLRNWARVTDSMNTGAKDLGEQGRVNAPAIFSYRSDEDTLAEIGGSNYFGREAQNIAAQDVIWATGSDGIALYRVTAVNRPDFEVSIQEIPGGADGIQSVVAGSGISVDNSDPQNPVVSATGASDYVESVTGAVDEINVDNTDPQNPVLSLSATIDTPGTFTVQSTVAIEAIIDDDTMAAASDTNIPTAESVKAYIDGLDNGSVKSVSGTTEQIDVDNADPQNPVLSLSSTIDAPGTFTIQGTTAVDSIINDDTMATAAADNLATALSIKNYVDGLDSGSVKSVSGTANQIDVDNTDAQNPVLSLSSTLAAPGTIAVGNLFFDTNTISSADTDGDLILTPDGTGNLVLDGLNWPQADGTAGYVLATDGLGQLSWESGGMSWTEVTASTASLAADEGFIANNATGVTFTLPVTAALGTQISIIGKGAGGWVIEQNAGQNIQIGSVSSTVGVTGSVASNNQFDSLTLICTTADTTWTVLGGPQSAGLTID